MCNAEVITDVLYYADAETNTKHKKVDAEVGHSLSSDNSFIDTSRQELQHRRIGR